MKLDTLPGAADAPHTVHWRSAAARNLAGAWLAPAEAQGHPTLREAVVWAAKSGLPHPFLNSATLLQPLADADAPALIVRLRRFYSEGVSRPWAIWSAWPTPDLEPFGGTFVGQPPLMVRPPAPHFPAPAELTIREAKDAATLGDFERIFIMAYPVPELQPYRTGVLFTPPVLGGNYRPWIGYVEEQPVTCAISYASGDVVGIHFVATVPEARGRGYGAAITARAAASAPTLPAVLQASDLGRPVYERLGFSVVSRFDLWVFPSDGP